MSNVIYYEGFDQYTLSLSQVNRGWSGNPSSYIAGRFGGQAMRLTNQGGIAVLLPGAAAYSSLTVGFASRNNFPSTQFSLIDLSNNGIKQCSLWQTSTGALQFTRGNVFNTNVLCASAAGLINPNTWNFIEVEFVRDASVGSVNIYLNGAKVAMATGVNTGASDINQVGVTATVGGSFTYDTDDLYVSRVRLGECRVETLRPNADASVQWTPNSGANNFSRVADATYDGDTSYVASSTVGAQDLYQIADLSTSPANIFAVQANILARKDDATTRQVATVVKSGSTTQVGVAQNVTASYSNVIDLYETNPATSAAWTVADVNALQVGQQVIS